jgi:hypothetical protein
MPRKPARPKSSAPTVDFTTLVDAIRQVHENCAAQASQAVNVSLTLRNWAIGCYIRDYEQNGADRAKYGERLLENLSKALKSKGVGDMTARSLRLYRQFFLVYPEIWQSAIAKSGDSFPPGSIWQSLTAKFGEAGLVEIRGTVSPKSRIVKSVTPELAMDRHTLMSRLSFTHLAELIAIDDPLKRAFYEVECIRGNWSVRALKRQIASLYFERSGLSTDKKKLAAMAHAAAEQAEPKLVIRDPYIFEFLGLKPREAVAESDPGRCPAR